MVKMKSEGKKPNHLINEKSPYLLQHSYNPVDWYPWGEEAFEKARNEGKPIFLSIGYSTCHWCHVMARESFEDDEVAELMNEVFVPIKVDREERPDVDGVYMRVCQIMTGSGGWPLTIIMTPDKKPFFAATYLPRKGRAGMPGMMELLPAVKKLWEGQREGLESIGEKVVHSIKKSSYERGDVGKEIFLDTYKELTHSFDYEYGGFGISPKFPTPHNLIFLLRYWKRSGDGKALYMVEKTLQAMRLGGIYDHLGFGFHRYSTDRIWHVPHFEKMLYDQAMISMAYAEAYLATGVNDYRKTAEEVVSYVKREMTSPEGAFYSAEDADSEGKEGLFYFWDVEEIKKILGEEAGMAARVFGIGKENAIPHMSRPVSEIAAEEDIDEEKFLLKMEETRKKLFEEREKRIHPGKDDKILTGWNGLMIASLAIISRAFGERNYSKIAVRAADFILENMCSKDGELLHMYREGASVPAYLDDYAFFIWGLIELYEATFDIKFLEKAIDLNNKLLEKFWDEKEGGFYFTSDDSLLIKQKESIDGAIPSGNSIAMLNMLRLGRMTAETDLEKKAYKMVKTFSGEVKDFPSAHTSFVTSLDFMFGPSYEVVVAGDSSSEKTMEMIRAINSMYVPNKVMILRPTEKELPTITDIASFTKEMNDMDGSPAVYVCRGYACQTPVKDADKIRELFD